MEQTPSWEPKKSLTSQDILQILWNREFHCLIHKRQPPVTIVRRINSVHAPSHFLKIHFIIIYPPMRSSSKCSLSLSLSLRFPHQSPICTFLVPHNIIIDLITRIIFGDEYRSLSSSLCDLPHFPVTSSLLGRNMFLSTLFPNTISLGSSLNVRDQVWHLYKTTYKITVLYILIFVFLDRRMEDKRFFTKCLQRNYIT
jgi:hypothetical protein